jgi:hypothetical protein
MHTQNQHEDTTSVRSLSNEQPEPPLIELQQRQKTTEETATQQITRGITDSADADTGDRDCHIPPVKVEGPQIARGTLYNCPDWAWATITKRDPNTAFLDILRFTKGIIPLTYPVITCLRDQLIKADYECWAVNVPEIHHIIIRAPSDSSVTKQVIGLNGHYFNITTENYNLLFIWHRRHDNTFHFWGKDYTNVLNAVAIIRDRIYKKSAV